MIVIIEKFVFKNLLSCWSFTRIPSQHFSDKLNSLWTGPVNNLVQRDRIILVKINLVLSHKDLSFGPLGGSSQNLTNLIQLVDFGTSTKQWGHQIQFSHDASKCKNIHRRIIVVRFQNNLGGSVPTGGNIVRERWTRPDFTR